MNTLEQLYRNLERRRAFYLKLSATKGSSDAATKAKALGDVLYEMDREARARVPFCLL